MKWLITILTLCFIGPVFAQEDPALLAREITKGLVTDRQKVASIFKWITNNISYNTLPRYKRAIIGASSAKFRQDAEADEDTGALKPLNERVAITVLQKKVAFCEGYARLFNTLCDYAGVSCVMIPGYARTNNGGPNSRFGVNHYWNAVFIDSSWKLLDVTWGAGYVNGRGDEFVQQYDGRYFLTAPEDFIRDHYPDDLQWTLLADSPMPKEFRNAPFRQKSYYKYPIRSYAPSKGMIDATIGDTIRLQLETANLQNDRHISPDLLIDSTIFSRSASAVFLRPVKTDSLSSYAGRLHYEYVAASPQVEWLYLLYNGDIVLRYRIQAIRPKAVDPESEVTTNPHPPAKVESN